MIHTSYFELFGLSETFTLDEDSLKRGYYKESRKYHPDFFVSASDIDKNNAVRMSEFVNEAYRTLSDKQSRIRYMLLRNGVLSEGDNPELDQDFLLEMMDINESIFDLHENQEEMDKQSKDNAWLAIDTEILAFEASLERMGTAAMVAFDGGDHHPAQLEKVKEYYLKSKYLQRIREHVHRDISID